MPPKPQKKKLPAVSPVPFVPPVDVESPATPRATPLAVPAVDSTIRETRESNKGKRPGLRLLPGWDADNPNRPPTPPPERHGRAVAARVVKEKEELAMRETQQVSLQAVAQLQNRMRQEDEAATSSRHKPMRPNPIQNSVQDVLQNESEIFVNRLKSTPAKTGEEGVTPRLPPIKLHVTATRLVTAPKSVGAKYSAPSPSEEPSDSDDATGEDHGVTTQIKDDARCTPTQAASHDKHLDVHSDIEIIESQLSASEFEPGGDESDSGTGEPSDQQMDVNEEEKQHLKGRGQRKVKVTRADVKAMCEHAASELKRKDHPTLAESAATAAVNRNNIKKQKAGEHAQDPKGKGKQRAMSCKSTPTARPLPHPQPEEEEDWAGVDEYTGGYHDVEDSIEHDAMDADAGASRLFWRLRESLDDDDHSQQQHSGSRVSAQWPKGTPASSSTPLVPYRCDLLTKITPAQRDTGSSKKKAAP
ncbi:hypothetical protein C8Q74DRAFT_1373581 [Fomes fomentarius]|nr:hypothetical protein C8Q74DRAFT_1373581 [Fomes fomentarius]